MDDKKGTTERLQTLLDSLIVLEPSDAEVNLAADLSAVGRMLRDVLARLRMLLGDVAYNLVFHSAPRDTIGPFHWHVHVLPQLTTIAGFEQGTAVRINVVTPEQAASQLAPLPASASASASASERRRQAGVVTTA